MLLLRLSHCRVSTIFSFPISSILPIYSIEGFFVVSKDFALRAEKKRIDESIYIMAPYNIYKQYAVHTRSQPFSFTSPLVLFQMLSAMLFLYGSWLHYASITKVRPLYLFFLASMLLSTWQDSEAKLLFLFTTVQRIL